MKSLLDADFEYTKVEQQGPDYLRERFRKIRERQAQEAAARSAKISEIKPRIKAKQ